MRKLAYLAVLAIMAGTAPAYAALIVGWDGHADGAEHVSVAGVTGVLFTGNSNGVDASKGSNDGTYGDDFAGAPTGAQGAYKVATISHLNRIRVRVVNNTGSDLQLDAVHFDYSRWFANSPQDITLSYHTGDLSVTDDTAINSVSGLLQLGTTTDYDDFDWLLTGLADSILADGEQAEFDLTTSAGNTATASGAFDNVAISGTVVAVPEPAALGLLSMLGLGLLTATRRHRTA